MNYPYTLRIVGPSSSEIRNIDPPLWDEIDRDRDSQDNDERAVRRYLGGVLLDLDRHLNLPEGWEMRIDDRA